MTRRGPGLAQGGAQALATGAAAPAAPAKAAVAVPPRHAAQARSAAVARARDAASLAAPPPARAAASHAVEAQVRDAAAAQIAAGAALLGRKATGRSVGAAGVAAGAGTSDEAGLCRVRLQAGAAGAGVLTAAVGAAGAGAPGAAAAALAPAARWVLFGLAGWCWGCKPLSDCGDAGPSCCCPPCAFARDCRLSPSSNTVLWVSIVSLYSSSWSTLFATLCYVVAVGLSTCTDSGDVGDKQCCSAAGSAVLG